MNEDQDAPDMRDPGLEALFRRTHAERMDETFVAATMRRVEARKARLRLGRRLAEGALLIAIVVASPWLIDASAWLSSWLGAGLAVTSSWLATPAGAAIGVAIIAGFLVLRPLLARWLPLLRYRLSRLR